MVETFEGQIESIIFHNNENGYTVAVMAAAGDEVTIIGSMPYVYEGENVKVSGEWTYHQKYGRQLKIIDYERILPNTIEAVNAYLSSGMFRGIGEVTASRITEKFGEDTLDVIAFYPQRLAEVKGISKKKAKELAVEFELQKELRDLTIFLQKNGLGPAFAPRVYKELGNDSIDKIKQNPYLLADKVQGIGFKTADRIAFNLGIEKNSEFRIKSGIVYTLFRASNAGHTYLPRIDLMYYASGILGVDPDHISIVFDNFLFERSLINDDDNIYLPSLYSAEKNAAFKLSELFMIDPGKSEEDLGAYIEEYEAKEKIVFEKEQRDAVVNCIRNGTSIITGGPGTGKTTIIKGLIFILDKLGFTYALCAPTGRAAKRMEEATGIDAKTIHRLLEAGYVENSRDIEFRKNSQNPLDYDFVIVDEMSMIDINLFSSLLAAIMPGSRVVMVGDKDQLPSVGPGSVLKDILKSKVVSFTQLKHIFRQDENSLIVYNAHRINNGDMPVIDNSSKDFFVVSKKKQDICAAIIDLVTENLPAKYSYGWREDISILTPVRKGELGVEGLNERLRQVLNPGSPDKKEAVIASTLFREGDRVMQTRNNYGIRWYKYNQPDFFGEGLYNGDIGFIESIDVEKGIMEVIYDKEKVGIYERLNYEELEPAFASTIHKSQGSEFNVVIIPLFNAPGILMTRNLLYTALTRAKKMVIFVGDIQKLKEMVENDKENKRYTSLDKRLCQFINYEL